MTDDEDPRGKAAVVLHLRIPLAVRLELDQLAARYAQSRSAYARYLLIDGVRQAARAAREDL